MIKLVYMVKRRPGMSLEAFKDYYETHHKEIGVAAFPGRAIRYMRRYLTPIAHPTDGTGEGSTEFDALTEIWFEDEEAYRETMALFHDTPLGRFVVEDEARLFDRGAMRSFVVVEELETELDPANKRTREEAEAMLDIERPR